jgi:hypothetical protein
MGQTALAAAPRAEEAAPQRADAEALPRKARRRRVPVAERRAAQDAANAGDAAGGDGALEEESAQAATRVGPRSAQDADASHMRRRRQRRRLPRLRGAVSDAASVVSEDAEAALPDLERGLRGGGGGGGGDGDGDGDGENGRGVSSNDHSGSDADGASHSGSGAEDSVASPRDEDGGGVAHSGDEEKDDKAPSAPDMPPDMDMPAFLGDVDPFRVGFEDMMRDEFDLHRELAEHDVSTIDRLYHQELDQVRRAARARVGLRRLTPLSSRRVPSSPRCCTWAPRARSRTTATSPSSSAATRQWTDTSGKRRRRRRRRRPAW